LRWRDGEEKIAGEKRARSGREAGEKRARSGRELSQIFTEELSILLRLRNKIHKKLSPYLHISLLVRY
jgi:hypothetical protein